MTDHDTRPDVWNLSKVGNLILDVQEELRSFRRAVVERLEDLHRRVDALEHGQRLVSLESGDGDNGPGGG